MTPSTSEVAVWCSARVFAPAPPRTGDVLDRDHSLVGKGRDQLDLLVDERPHLLTVNGNHAGQLIVLEHRHYQYAADTGQASEGAARAGGGEITPPAVHKGPLPVRQERRRPTALFYMAAAVGRGCRSASCQCQAPTITISCRARRLGRPARACGHRDHGACMMHSR
jgi:hypothetical protein